MGAFELLEKIMSLTSSVGTLQGTTDKLWDKVERHADKISKLENREDALIANMAGKTTEAVQRLTSDIYTRLTRLETKVFGYGPSSSDPLLPKPSSGK
jgi:phage shock protein A